MDRIQTIQRLIQTVESLVPRYLEDPVDFQIAEGNMALYILDQDGNLHGKMFGSDPAKQRISGRVAWHKVTQVWLTREATGTYEKKVYNDEVRWWEFGVPKNEFIGWEGGLPARLSDGTFLSVALSGLRGDRDCDLLREAAIQVGGIEFPPKV